MIIHLNSENCSPIFFAFLGNKLNFWITSTFICNVADKCGGYSFGYFWNIAKIPHFLCWQKGINPHIITSSWVFGNQSASYLTCPRDQHRHSRFTLAISLLTYVWLQSSKISSWKWRDEVKQNETASPAWSCTHL